MRLQTIFAVLAALCVAACQTDASQTASGSPEKLLSGIKPEQAKPLILNAAMNRGLKLKSDTQYQLTFEQPWAGNRSTAAMMGLLLSADGTEVKERLVFSIADQGTGTRVVLDRYMIHIGGFGREDASPANNGAGTEDLQTILDSVTSGIKTASVQR